MFLSNWESRNMKRGYDLFEMSDFGLMWRGRAVGLLKARDKLVGISQNTDKECFAVHVPTREIVARLNRWNAQGEKPLVVAISYDTRLAVVRAEALRLCGYDVTSIIGNQAAKAVLGLRQPCDLFLVGPAAPEKIRTGMVSWLKEQYPGLPILALNEPTITSMTGADYNVEFSGAGSWLAALARLLPRKIVPGLD